jgi:hypothetical protein
VHALCGLQLCLKSVGVLSMEGGNSGDGVSIPPSPELMRVQDLGNLWIQAGKRTICAAFCLDRAKPNACSR